MTYQNRKYQETNNQLRWVILLLATVVIVPTVCLLWFMNAAIDNARFAYRQKMADFYQKQVQDEIEERWAPYWLDVIGRMKQFDALTNSAVSPAAMEHIPVLFGGLLIYDNSGGIEWPVLDKDDDALSDVPDDVPEIFEKAYSYEFAANDYENAMAEYQRLFEGDPNFLYQASLGMIRCREKMDQLSEAIGVCETLVDAELLRPDQRLTAQIRLAQLYVKDQNPKATSYIQQFLGDILKPEQDQHKEISTALTTWALEKLIDLAAQAGGEIPQETIQSAKALLSRFQVSLTAAYANPLSERFQGQPTESIFIIGDDEPLYALKIQSQDNLLIGLIQYDSLQTLLDETTDSLNDETVAAWIYTDKNIPIQEYSGEAGSPLASIPLGSVLPDWTIRVVPRDSDSLISLAGKQTTAYLWTGILVIGLVLTSGAVAVQAVGRQIRLNRLKNNFIATVTHELKTPLASTRVLVDTLLHKRYESDEQSQDYLAMISQENERLSRLIDNFLTFSRMERNKKAFEFDWTDPAEVVREAAAAVKAKFSGESCDFSATIPDSLPSIYVDKDALVTVLVNLLDNAYKYTRQEKAVELRAEAQDGCICFSVKDNGIGMTARQKQKIFDRFYQADNSLARRAEGCGLGLSIVKFIVDAHKGKIEVESSAGKGSKFIVRIPRAQE